MADQDSVPIEIDLKLPTFVFRLQDPELSHLHEEARKALWEGIVKDQMAPYLQTLPETILSTYLPPTASTDASSSISTSATPSPPPVSATELISHLTTLNAAALQALDEKIKSAEDSLGDVDVSEPLREKAGYLCKIGDQALAPAALSLALSKTPGIGARIDLVMASVRLGMFYGDFGSVESGVAKAAVAGGGKDEVGGNVQEGIEKATELIDQGGDWDRRNRLKIYTALSLLSQRKFAEASTLLTDSLSTFSATELMSYEEFVELTVLVAGVGLDRKGVKTKIIASAEINSLMPQMPALTLFTKSLYECDYEKFFSALAQVEEQYLLPSPLLAPHARFFVREMRIKAYAQILESYRSLTIERMSKAFGVSVGFLDADLAKFIASGRLACTIDKVSGVITTDKGGLGSEAGGGGGSGSGNKASAYEAVVKQGDLLLNEIQKLSRVIG